METHTIRQVEDTFFSHTGVGGRKVGVQSPISAKEESNVASNEVNRLLQSLTPVPENEIKPIVQDREQPHQNLLRLRTQRACKEDISIKSDYSDSAMIEFASEEVNIVDFGDF